ncbi:N-carbamoyl-D-amino acid hydrolase [Zhongshania aliphaticivorans]|uniref:N-carbamoyl-D-amino acid hydrolase n=1 Tax=Zhongshania aliphaticivorans TaxID=1470434 RepID=A0A5S9MX02_9GAMM|nr:nitrilase-related carbon-nitrogen hydrolase [Zhongshania aliphaticivorans]CAA0081962.1 N-carbamoyl-D-amino acid hydrolase [Zhongshania aliphaticivorans]CAA0084552.1 N-carbamoyl-D-amino acid hydrolase [Zhongshania aliphaticivorans]
MSASSLKQVRVAAAQCAIGSNVEQNLETCLRVLDKAAQLKPDLVVLPEFSNHLSWYDGAEHCFEVSLDIDSPFLSAIANKAKEIGAFVSIGATLRRAGGSVSGSALLYSPSGELLGIADKQVLIGHENDFLTLAQEAAPIIETELGRIAMYMCMDGVINETPRCLALRGAQILCNSLNSFAPDEGNLHIPVRAAENKVFVVAANKVGPLVPEEMMAGISAATNIPEVFLCGAGESQIVAPDGTVLAMAETDGEEVVSALITPALADDKRRPDGSDIFAVRRPALYTQLGVDPALADAVSCSGENDISAALLRCDTATESDICELVSSAQKGGARLITLSPQSGFDAIKTEELAAWYEKSQRLIASITAQLSDDVYVVCPVVAKDGERYQHQLVLLSATGILASQGQVHYSERFAWSSLADGFSAYELPFATISMLTSDDSIFPEAFRLCALSGAEVVVVAVMPSEAWELKTGLVERAAENRVNLLAPSLATEFGCGFAASLHEDFTVFGEWKTREFDGVLTRPALQLMHTDDAITHVTINAANAENKVVSRNTHLLDNRPWHLLDAMTTAV